MTYRYADLSEYDWLQEQIIFHESEQAKALGILLYDRLRPASVADIGCGPGIYLTPFKERGCTIYGVDGAPAAGEVLAPGEFELVDLRNPWTPPRVFDLALCIEVGEHLMPEHHLTLVETVSKCAPTVFWSAATPGQGGEGHHGEATPEYWFGLFDQAGFSLDSEMTQALHEVIDIDPPYAHCNWLRLHSHLLRRR